MKTSFAFAFAPIALVLAACSSDDGAVRSRETTELAPDEAEVRALEVAIERDAREGARALVRTCASSVSSLSPEAFARLRARVEAKLTPDDLIELVEDGLEFAPASEGLRVWLQELEDWNSRILRGADSVGY